jgi:hypothetical protein
MLTMLYVIQLGWNNGNTPLKNRDLGRKKACEKLGHTFSARSSEKWSSQPLCSPTPYDPASGQMLE